MPICFRCGESVDSLSPSGLCPKCRGGAARPAESLLRDDKLKYSVEQRAARDLAAQKTAQEKQVFDAKIQALSDSGLDGYYEYKVVNLCDYLVSGIVDIERMTATLNELGLDGWRLRIAYSNDLGINMLKIAGVGLNSSVSQNIMIFERFVPISK